MSANAKPALLIAEQRFDDPVLGAEVSFAVESRRRSGLPPYPHLDFSQPCKNGQPAEADPLLSSVLDFANIKGTD